MAGGSVLSASVGAGGANQAPDVGLVQILLNVMRGMQDKTLLAVDGIPGPLTIAAIREFQTEFAPTIDGRVDPGGRTLHLLIYSYISIIRLGVKGLGTFPPSFGTLPFEERIDAGELGDVLRNALLDIKRGITPMLRAGPAPAPKRPVEPPVPRPPSPPKEIPNV
jgi:peptidoglycan hydrolase-like protein with peptidoglycan-binding domain